MSPNNQINKVSVIITTYRAVAYLHCCIRSLVRTVDKSSLEVIIYGDGGGEESQEMIKTCAVLLKNNEIEVITCYSEHNSGICPSLNEACKLATGDWLFIANDDMVFPMNWLKKSRALLKRNRVLSLSAIEPPLTGRGIADCYYAENLGLDPENFDFHSLENFQEHLPDDSIERGVNYPFFIEKDVFQEVGGIDENFPGPYHDPDLFLRLRNAGFEMLRTRSIALYHFSGISLRFGENANKVFKKSLNWIKKENKARLYFIRKWGHKPKTRFGYIPKSKALKPWKDEKHSLLDYLRLTALLVFETANLKFREWRYK